MSMPSENFAGSLTNFLDRARGQGAIHDMASFGFIALGAPSPNTEPPQDVFVLAAGRSEARPSLHTVSTFERDSDPPTPLMIARVVNLASGDPKIVDLTQPSRPLLAPESDEQWRDLLDATQPQRVDEARIDRYLHAVTALLKLQHP